MDKEEDTRKGAGFVFLAYAMKHGANMLHGADMLHGAAPSPGRRAAAYVITGWKGDARMDEKRIRQEELFGRLPAEWAEDLLPAIQAKVREAGRKVVVLDDDPTGTQTVHGVPVLTQWAVEALAAELAGSAPAFYLLTNSRSLPKAEAEALGAAIGERLRQAQEQAAGNRCQQLLPAELLPFPAVIRPCAGIFRVRWRR